VCSVVVVCAPAIPGLSATSFGLAVAQNFPFSKDPASLFIDFGVDSGMLLVDNAAGVPAPVTFVIGEGVKRTPEINVWKERMNYLWEGRD
jgi:hypothetical protein